jgi:ADP-ribosylglycohydrolase
MPFPKLENLHDWEKYHSQLLQEYRQCVDEGKDIKQFKELFQAVHNMPESKAKFDIADILYKICFETPVIENYKYNEPSDIEEIKKLRKGSNVPVKTFSKSDLYNKVKGAWIGRICGCLLGKPLECIMHDELDYVLKKTGNYPLNRYIKQSEITEDILKAVNYKFPCKTFPDTIKNAPSDDDTNYTVMASNIIENYGSNFTSENVAYTWLRSQPKDAYCTAERVAYLNIIKGYSVNDSAIYKNPFREWIGAQIRADYFGYINPFDVETASEMAWRDARISHVKNGIYGEMFVAAMLAASYSYDNIKDIISAGLSMIPATSRLYERLTRVIEFYDKGNTYEDFLKDLYVRYNDKDCYDWCHTISNAEIVTAALLYGGGDFGKSICMAVQAGFDTDCNGATVGSVMGLKNGFDCIDRIWYEPLNGKLDTDINDMRKVQIEDMVTRTIKHIESYSKKL